MRRNALAGAPAATAAAAGSGAAGAAASEYSCFYYDLVPTSGKSAYVVRFEDIIGNGRILVGVAPAAAARCSDIYKHPSSCLVYASKNGHEPAGWWTGNKQTAPLAPTTRKGGGWIRGERCVIVISCKPVDNNYSFTMEFGVRGSQKWEKVREWTLNEPLYFVIGIADPGTSVTCWRAK